MKPGEEPTFYSDASSDEEDETTAKSTGVVQEEKKSQWGTKARKIHTQKSELIKQQKDPNWTEIINWFYLQSWFFFLSSEERTLKVQERTHLKGGRYQRMKE